MDPLHFKEYATSQRIFRRKLNKDYEEKKIKKWVYWFQRANMEMPLMLCDAAVPAWELLNQVTNPKQNCAKG